MAPTSSTQCEATNTLLAIWCPHTNLSSEARWCMPTTQPALLGPCCKTGQDSDRELGKGKMSVRKALSEMPTQQIGPVVGKDTCHAKCMIVPDVAIYCWWKQKRRVKGWDWSTYQLLQVIMRLQDQKHICHSERWPPQQAHNIEATNWQMLTDVINSQRSNDIKVRPGYTCILELKCQDTDAQQPQHSPASRVTLLAVTLVGTPTEDL